MTPTPHLPVLVKEFLSFFSGKQVRLFVDGTLGSGGHSLALLQAHREIELLIGLDQDKVALEMAAERLAEYQSRLLLIHGDFKDLSSLIEKKWHGKIDGLFFDLGVSSMQLQVAERGFSFQQPGPLDMRKNRDQSLTAEIIINSYSEKQLADIFWQFGEEPRSRRAARAIVEARKRSFIRTTDELSQILKQTLTWRGRRNRHIHPHTLVFQALRIAVNDELASLKSMIPQALQLLHPEGRLGIISFHSLEDRIVKQSFRAFADKKEGYLLTKKPIVASDEEIASNSQSRSAKMRFIEKTAPSL